MRMVVIDGRGLIGAQVVDRLRARGHEVASRSSGIDAIDGEGLSTAPALALR